MKPSLSSSSCDKISLRRAGVVALALLLLMPWGLPGRAQSTNETSNPASPWDAITARASTATGSGWNGDKAALALRPQYQAYYQKYANWTAPEPANPPVGKLRNLSDTPKQPRFPLTDKDWPAEPGQASVCLWEDDKVAAYSFSIDDNMASDVPFWRDLSTKYGGLNITWNLITINIDGKFDPAPGHVAVAGTWALWQSILAAGYHLASHSVTHVGDPVSSDGWPGPDWETSESQKTLDENLPGHKAKFFVYPGSPLPEFNNSGAWRPSVVKYFAAARGVSGIPINQANQIDYFGIRTTAHPENAIQPSDPKFAEYDITNILNSDASRPQHKYYRGWATTFIHGVGGGASWETQPYYIAHAKVFDWVTAHRDDIWIGFLDDVALYGQERDTATLKIDESTSTRIAFSLTSQMDPTVFDYPLTVKVHLPDAWKAVSATQGGKAIPAQLIQHDGANFALVKAVPDQGQVVLIPGKT